VFKKTITLEGDYKIGWIFHFPPWARYSKMLTILHLKVSKINEPDDYITVIGLFGREFILK
jgi:hypothetical protein